MWVCLILLVEGLNRMKGWVRKNALSLPDCLPGTLVFSCLQTWTSSVLLVLTLLDRLEWYHWLPWASSLSTADHGLVVVLIYWKKSTYKWTQAVWTQVVQGSTAIYYINRLMKKNHMIISKHVEKNPSSIHNTNSQQTRNRRELNLIPNQWHLWKLHS